MNISFMFRLISLLVILASAKSRNSNCDIATRRISQVSFSFFSSNCKLKTSFLRINCGHRRGAQSKKTNFILMRDHSSAYWFCPGDRVQVVEDVFKGQQQNLKGLIGTVLQTFEKCEVDPTCCCAEFVDRSMAVTVEFSMRSLGNEDYNKVSFVTSDSWWDGEPFLYYFAEEELNKLTDLADSVAFDGMSCTEFKLEKLGLYRSSSKDQ